MSLENDPIKNLPQQTITAQPTNTVGITSSVPTLFPHSGLNVLRDMPSLHIHQIYELNDVLTTVSSENRYTVRTPGNEAIFAASEGSDPKDRAIWGSSRPFTIHVIDRSHQEIFTMSRSFGFRFLCFPIKYQKMDVWMNNSIFIGSITEKFSFFSRHFSLDNEQGQPVYKFEVPTNETYCMPKEASFRILSIDQTQQIATITRQWNIDISSYTINIYFNERSLDPKMKAILLSAGFLLEYLYFQSSCC